MARQYAIQSWVKHDDDHPNLLPDIVGDYSGEQVGNRKRASVAVTPGYDQNGNADLGYYSDPNETFKTNPLFQVDPAFKVLAGYQELADQLRNALDKGLIGKTVHSQAMQLLNVKIDKAERKIKKAFEHTFINDEPLIGETIVSEVVFPEDEIVSEKISLESEAYAIYCYENEII